MLTCNRNTNFLKLCNDSNNEHVYCTLCTGEFSVAHKGKGDIEDHVKTAKHRSATFIILVSNT
jgi:hypothetical protein